MYETTDYRNILIADTVEEVVETEPCTESLNHRLELCVSSGMGRISLSAWIEGVTQIRTIDIQPINSPEDQRLMELQAQRLADRYNTLTVFHTRW